MLKSISVLFPLLFLFFNFLFYLIPPPSPFFFFPLLPFLNLTYFSFFPFLPFFFLPSFLLTSLLPFSLSSFSPFFHFFLLSLPIFPISEEMSVLCFVLGWSLVIFCYTRNEASAMMLHVFSHTHFIVVIPPSLCINGRGLLHLCRCNDTSLGSRVA